MTGASVHFDFRGTERFEVVGRLGEGGMGVVYEVLDRERGGHVALKTLRHLSAVAILRIKEEFRALADLDHPNLISLYELFEANGHWFFTMELVHGTDFLGHVRPSAPPSMPGSVNPHAVTIDAPLLPAESAPPGGFVDVSRLRLALSQLAVGLSVLHARGKVHRDIKPSNIRVTEAGRVVLLDFGLVWDLDRERSWTETNLVGTPEYMAPEQAASKSVGAEADWYSVGVLLYEALTGRLPYLGRPLEIMMNKQRFAPAAPSEIARNVPEDLNALAVELLRFDPAARPTERQVLARLGVAAPALQSARSAPSASRHNATPFVGRARELRSLREAYLAVRQHTAVTVLLEGASGIGKSALVQRFTSELAAQESDVVVLTGRCYERESVPYKAVDGIIDSLSRYMTRLRDTDASVLVPVNAVVLAQVFPVLRRAKAMAEAPRTLRTVEPQEQRTRVFGALRELLTRLADRHPLILVIDDLQWADADSLHLLSSCMRPPDPPPLLLLATMRTGAAVRGDSWLAGAVQTIEVRALPPDDARELAASLLARTPNAGGDPGAIAAEAAGHPLFIDELVQATEGGPGATVLQLDAALWSRILRLDGAQRRLLECVAVAGAPIAQDVASNAAALGLGALARNLSLLRTANLVRTSGARGTDTIEPYHDRIRETVLGHIDAAAKRAHHRSLALALEAAGRGELEALSANWQGAGDDDRAANYAEQAAALAMQALAFDRAAGLYRRSLELRITPTPGTPPPPAERMRALRVRLGEALANAGRGKEAAGAYLGAVEGATAAEALDYRRRAAEQLFFSGHLDEGLEAIRTVLGELGMHVPRTPRAALASLLLRRAGLRLRGLGFRERDASQVSAEDLRRVDACWSVAAGLSMTDHIRGADFQTRHLRLALTAGEPRRIARALAIEVAFLAAAGGPSRRRIAQVRAIADGLAVRTQDPFIVALSAAAAACAAFLAGGWREGLEQSRAAEALFRAECTGAAWEIGSMQIIALWSLFYLGNVGELARQLPAHLADAIARGDQHHASVLRLSNTNMGWVARGEVARARAEVQAALSAWSLSGFHLQHYYGLLAEAQFDLYEGKGALAYGRVASQWEPLEGSLLLRSQLVRIQALHLRARAAIAAADEDSATRKVRLLEAEKLARRIAREDLTCSSPFALLLEGGVAGVRGDLEGAAGLAARAAIGFDAAGMSLHATASRACAAALRGGEEGSAARAEAREWMLAQGVREPARMVAMIAPGFSAR